VISSSTAKEVIARVYLFTSNTVYCWHLVKLCSWRCPIKLIVKMHHIGNYEEFSFIYSSLQCYSENEDCEEAVVEWIAAKHQETSDQETDEGDTTEHEGVRVQILVPICWQA
jgi:hypothetical protein